MNKEIGKNIKYYRQLNGISREDLANQLEISIHTLAKYEQGQREANYETLNKICTLLKINIHDVFGEESISDTFYKNIYNDLHGLTSTRDIIELLFLHNDTLNKRLNMTTNSKEDKNYFFAVVSEFIDNELKDLNLLTMPSLRDD